MLLLKKIMPIHLYAFKGERVMLTQDYHSGLSMSRFCAIFLRTCRIILFKAFKYNNYSKADIVQLVIGKISIAAGNARAILIVFPRTTAQRQPFMLFIIKISLPFPNITSPYPLPCTGWRRADRHSPAWCVQYFHLHSRDGQFLYPFLLLFLLHPMDNGTSGVSPPAAANHSNSNGRRICLGLEILNLHALFKATMLLQ